MANFEAFFRNKKSSSNLFFLKNGYGLGALCKFEEPLKFVESSLKMSSVIWLVFVCFSKRYKEKYHDIYVTILPSMAQAEFDAIFVPLASSLFESFELGFSDFMNWKSFSSSWWSFCCWYIFINFSYNSLGMHVVPVYSVGKKNWFIIIRKNGKYIEENIYHIYLHTFISSRFFGFHFIWIFFWIFNCFICGKIIREKLEHNNFESKSNI